MNSATSENPSTAAIMPAFFASSPTVGETESSASSLSGTGSAPALRSFASCCASATEKLPEIWPLVSISPCRTGAEISAPSRMIASSRPRSVAFFAPCAM